MKKINYMIKKGLLLSSLLLFSISGLGQIKTYIVSMDGSNESPPNASPGVGIATVTVDETAKTMNIQCFFSGLLGNTTVTHIHAATTTANTGNTGVAIPIVSGFPTGVTSGNYDITLDMTLATSYNATYITNNGGTTATAFTALVAAFDANKAYLNIHSSAFGGGEIRGFLSNELSTNDYELHSKIEVYPNPFFESITINNQVNKNLKMEIIDLIGKLIDTKNIGFETTQLDYSNLKSGIYFAKLSTANKQSTFFKIIKN